MNKVTLFILFAMMLRNFSSPRLALQPNFSMPRKNIVQTKRYKIHQMLLNEKMIFWGKYIALEGDPDVPGEKRDARLSVQHIEDMLLNFYDINYSSMDIEEFDRAIERLIEPKNSIE